MRRLILVFICLICFALPIALSAQEASTEPPADVPTSDELDAAVAEARDAAATARRYAEEAGSYLNIFESVGVAIGVLTGLVIPIAALLAGFFGWRGLARAQSDLTAARERFEQELKAQRDEMAEELAAEMGRKQAALDALKAELEASARYERVRSDQATLALSLLPLAERQYRADDFEGALHTYLRALELDPENIVIHYRLGYVYTQRDELDEAEKHLKCALKTDEKFAPALANLGFVFRKRADKLPPEDINRGQLMAEAEVMLREALKQSPKLVDEDGESWWGSLGGLHRRRGQIDDAITAYEQALKITPAASYPVGNLALLYMRKNDQPRMMDTFRRTERLALRRVLADGGDFWGWADLLVARLALGKYDEAKEALEWVLASAPSTATHRLQNPIDTLRLLMAHVDNEAAARIRPFVKRMEDRLAQRDGVQAPTP